jgi:hypothetical protein
MADFVAGSVRTGAGAFIAPDTMHYPVAPPYWESIDGFTLGVWPYNFGWRLRIPPANPADFPYWPERTLASRSYRLLTPIFP